MAPGRESNPGRADLVTGTHTNRPPHLPLICTINSASGLEKYKDIGSKVDVHEWVDIRNATVISFSIPAVSSAWVCRNFVFSAVGN